MIDDRTQEIRAEHAALLMAVAMVDEDPLLRMEARIRATGDAIHAMLVYLRTADLLAEQLGRTREEALDDLRAQLGRLVARYGHLLEHVDDDTPAGPT